jgi:hypothetical protein
MIYLARHLERVGLGRHARIGVLPVLAPRLEREVCEELRAVAREAEIAVVDAPSVGSGYDLIVVPLRRSLYRSFLGEKTRSLLRGFRLGARTLILYDVVRRRAEVVRRRDAAQWWTCRFAEYVAVRLARGAGWPRS